MKFYTYKNGEIAYFENNEKMLITKEEKEMLVEGNNPMDGSAIFSIVEYYISEKIDNNTFSKVLDEYRTNSYTKEDITVNVNGKEIATSIYKENDCIIAMKLSFMGNERITWKGRSDFDKAVAQLKSFGIN